MRNQGCAETFPQGRRFWLCAGDIREVFQVVVLARGLRWVCLTQLLGRFEMRKLGKEGLSEDLVRDAEDSVQSLTNNYSKKIDDIYTEIPFYGYRKIYYCLKEKGCSVGMNRVRLYMRELGLKNFNAPIDASDALAIALCHLYQLKLEEL